MSYDLHESESGTADANGKATATLQPLRAFERWAIKRMTIQSTSSTLVPTCKVYRGNETPSSLIDGSHTGTLDHSDTNIELQNGERLLFVWEGGDAGSVCTATIEGTTRR